MADGLKLSALLPDRLDAVGAQARQRLCENEDVGAMTLAWDYIGDELSGALGQALDCDLMEVLAKGWARRGFARRFRRPGETSRRESGRSSSLARTS